MGMHEAFKDRRDLTFLHPRPNAFPSVFHRQSRQFVGQLHAVDLLRGLDGAAMIQYQVSVDDFAGDRLKGIEPRLRPCARLAHHAVRTLRPLRKFEADAAGQIAFLQNLHGDIERARARRSRIGGMIALEEANVLRPRCSTRVFFLRLESDQSRLPFARKDRDVVALHAPVIRQIDDVIRRAHDQASRSCLS